MSDDKDEEDDEDNYRDLDKGKMRTGLPTRSPSKTLPGAKSQPMTTSAKGKRPASLIMSHVEVPAKRVKVTTSKGSKSMATKNLGLGGSTVKEDGSTAYEVIRFLPRVR
jgi:hypothetical protein